MQKLHKGPAYARALLLELGEAVETRRRSSTVRTIASALSLEIREVDAEGFEGALIRAKDFPLGAAVVRKSIREVSRKNFTIAHEIGHFLLPGHDQTDAVCAPGDIGNWGDASRNLEREADEFAAELLMPGSLVEPIVRSATPSLQVIEKIAKECGSSLGGGLALLRPSNGEVRGGVEYRRANRMVEEITLFWISHPEGRGHSQWNLGLRLLCGE